MMWRKVTQVAILLAVSSPLWGQVAKTFTWTNPTAYVDGTLMPSSDIKQTTISVAPTSGGTPTVVLVSPGAAAAYTSLPVFGSGTWYARAQTTSISWGTTSGFSNEVLFQVGVCETNPLSCTPRAPSGLTVQ
jgi:hypothetical protein